MKIEDLKELVKVVSESDLTTFRYEDEDFEIEMGKEKEVIAATPVAVQTVVPSPASATPAGTETAESVETKKDEIPDGQVVKSPLVGTFYSAPSSDAEAYVKVGDTVKKGQVLAIVEAMKLMNEIESDYDGTVAAILVENEQPVEYGQPLFVIR